MKTNTFMNYISQFLMKLEGIFKEFIHPENISIIVITFEVFQNEISGKDDNDEHL